MNPQKYVEFDTEAELLKWEEWCCRKYAAANSVEFPIPDDPPSTGLTYLYLQGKRKPSGGGVVRLDDDAMGFCDTAEVILTDSSAYSFDLAARAVPNSGLSDEGKAIFPSPPYG
jgi:hypothetical protein